METRKIGTLDVTVVGIGCNNFGRELDRDATQAVIHSALDHGIAFFDTADRYGKPATQSESFLGEALRGHRDDIVLATKFGRRLDDTRFGASAAYVRSATEASLQRLQTDHIDLMQLHIPDPQTPIAETLGALADLVREGKIREIGGSNFSASELRQMSAAAAAHDLPGFVSTQGEYSLLHRTAEADLLPQCRTDGIAFLPYRPLFSGLLTGKYVAGEAPLANTRIGSKDPDRQAALLSTTNLSTVASLKRFASARDHSLLDLAFAWLLAQPAVPSVIAGVSSARQVATNVAAAQWRLTPTDLAELDALLASIGTNTDGQTSTLASVR